MAGMVKLTVHSLYLQCTVYSAQCIPSVHNVYLPIIYQYAPSTSFIIAKANICRLSRESIHRIHLFEGTQLSEHEGREGPRHNSGKFQQFS